MYVCNPGALLTGLLGLYLNLVEVCLGLLGSSEKRSKIMTASSF